MKKYRLFLYLMIMNCFISLSNRLYPSALHLGKLVGFLQIISILLIYCETLKKKDVLFLCYLITFNLLVVVRLNESAIDLENAIYFSSTCLMLWKFSEPMTRLKLKNEALLMGTKLYKWITILLIIACIGLIFKSCWEDVNGQRVYFGFCESGHKLSSNLCFIGMLYLFYFWDKKFKIQQLIYFILPLLLLTLTGSRTYLVSYMIILIPLYIKKLRNYNLKILLIPILTITLGYFLINSSIINRFFLMGSNQYVSDNFWEATSSGRLIWWKIDINDFQNFDAFHKIFGKGFTYLYNLNQQLYGLKIDAHNDFITLLVSSGLFGVSGYVLILIRWIFKQNLYKKKSIIIILLTALMYIWNAMISGVFPAQQYMFANIILSIIFLDNIFVDTNGGSNRIQNHKRYV